MLVKEVEKIQKASYAINACSKVSDGSGNEVVAVTMYSTFDMINGKLAGGTYVNISQTIANAELYKVNKEQCKADYAEFSNYIDSILDGTQED